MDRVIGTWRALAAPRRAVPILVVAVPMVAAQWNYATKGWQVWLGVVMVVMFVVVAPAAWRVLFPRGARPRWDRLAVYAAVGAGPALVGLATLRVLGPSFLTAGVNLLVSLVLFWVGGWGLARDIDSEEELREARERAEKLRREAENARLLALRAQLDPHFLFNTLNAIAEWCRIDPAVAEEALLRLAAMLRAVLEGVGPERWPLARELELVDALFALHHVRDPDAFTIVREVPPEAAAWPVPPMILLPLAENAMTHGPRAGRRGEVALRVRVGESLRVRVENPGAFAGRREGGEGIAMVERRLALGVPGGSVRVWAEGERTIAEVVLPRTAP